MAVAADTFGARLRARRQQCRMTQDMLAYAAEVSRRSVEKYELSGTVPHLDIAARLAETLECKLDDLVPAAMRAVRDGD